jgi:hypothetical protein
VADLVRSDIVRLTQEWEQGDGAEHRDEPSVADPRFLCHDPLIMRSTGRGKILGTVDGKW